MWNVESGDLVSTGEGPAGLVRTVACMPDSKRMLVVTKKGFVYVWELYHGTPRRLEITTPFIRFGYNSVTKTGTVGRAVFPHSGDSNFIMTFQNHQAASVPSTISTIALRYITPETMLEITHTIPIPSNLYGTLRSSVSDVTAAITTKNDVRFTTYENKFLLITRQAMQEWSQNGSLPEIHPDGNSNLTEIST